ncbi:acyl carrier protein [Amycolatopsis sp. NPDC021455]|uniref:acyl carrier protein n=1 Tax=Amycolatopsis sp. NPDC021455 TaxID=3154901 RepID=UPI0033D9A31C
MDALRTADDEALCGWLTDRIAHYLDREPGDIDPDVPLGSYGMDSVSLTAMVGEIEDEYGLTLDPTTVWDYPTVVELSAYLAKLLAEPRP